MRKGRGGGGWGGHLRDGARGAVGRAYAGEEPRSDARELSSPDHIRPRARGHRRAGAVLGSPAREGGSE